MSYRTFPTLIVKYGKFSINNLLRTHWYYVQLNVISTFLYPDVSTFQRFYYISTFLHFCISTFLHFYISTILYIYISTCSIYALWVVSNIKRYINSVYYYYYYASSVTNPTERMWIFVLGCVLCHLYHLVILA